MDSTVHTNQRGRGGMIFSSPVISATVPLPFSAAMRS